MRRVMGAAFLCLLLVAAGKVRAEDNRFRVEGDLSFWWIIQEQVENGQTQAGSGDQAAQEASGFAFKQGRIAFAWENPDKRVEALLRIRLEERTDILDCWGAFHPRPWLNFYVGQMKIPSTAEVLRPDQSLDFITRTTFGKSVGDFALDRTPYISSLMSTHTYNRDLGIALKGAIPSVQAPALNYFLMVSNGTGANNFVGGNENPGFLYTNRFGDYFYGARLEAVPWKNLVLGGHYSLNRHENALLQDKKTAVDLGRIVWSADLQLTLPWGMQVQGFYGQGRMDDFFNSQRYFFDFSGWGAWVLQDLWKRRVQLGVRYDRFTTEFQRDGNDTEQDNWTFGVNYRPFDNFRLQANYEVKSTKNDFLDDLDDNIFFLNFQFGFDEELALRHRG
jgi:hypothetical protein